ncbi:MAG: rolling circle replication-associated protein [Lawsonibacter sp.]
MSKILKRVISGRLVSAVVYTPCAARDSPRQRAQKQKASSAARELLNARTSFQKLERTLAANFDNGDLYVTLTYDDNHLPDSRDAAVRRIRFFLTKLRKERKARNQPLMYIYTTEGCCPGGRLHHHLVLNSTGDDLEEIRRLWIYGENVELRRLAFSQDYTYEDLASYLTKEPREWGHPQVGERTWTPSLGLHRPKPETETIPDYVTLTAPPGAVILAREGPVVNGYGEFMWMKYMLPQNSKAKHVRAKRRRQRKE